MKRTYEYRLYPRKTERLALEIMLEQSREVYNAALAQCKIVYETTGKAQNGSSQYPYFSQWRLQAGILLGANCMVNILRRLDKAYAAFFRRIKSGETAGHPRFKGKERLNSPEFAYGNCCKLSYDEQFDRHLLIIKNAGNIKVKLHRFLPDRADLKFVIVKRKATGWYVNFQMECPDLSVEPNGLPSVGIDIGLLRLLTLSDGTQIDNPRWLRQALAELRVLQRKLARGQKGSNRRRTSRILLAKRYEHLANVRRDFWHKTTYDLVHSYGLIALEELSLGFMLRNSHLSQSAHDAGLGLFRQLLDYKAGNAGSHVTTVNPAYTSQVCSSCGAIVEKELNVRIHVCPECSLKLDRDVNAARNILALALKSARIEPSGINVGAVKAKRSLKSSLDNKRHTRVITSQGCESLS